MGMKKKNCKNKIDIHKLLLNYREFLDITSLTEIQLMSLSDKFKNLDQIYSVLKNSSISDKIKQYKLENLFCLTIEDLDFFEKQLLKTKDRDLKILIVIDKYILVKHPAY